MREPVDPPENCDNCFLGCSAALHAWQDIACTLCPGTIMVIVTIKPRLISGYDVRGVSGLELVEQFLRELDASPLVLLCQLVWDPPRHKHVHPEVPHHDIVGCHVANLELFCYSPSGHKGLISQEIHDLVGEAFYPGPSRPRLVLDPRPTSAELSCPHPYSWLLARTKSIRSCLEIKYLPI